MPPSDRTEKADSVGGQKNISGDCANWSIRLSPLLHSLWVGFTRRIRDIHSKSPSKQSLNVFEEEAVSPIVQKVLPDHDWLKK
jgi:hypothetical protein